MTRYLFVITVCASLATHAGLQAQVPDSDRVAQVKTSATAERRVRADRATVTIAYDASGATPLGAGAAVAARADSLRRALQALGIPRDSLVSASQWYWWRGRVEQKLSYIRDSISKDGVRFGVRHIQDTSYIAHDAIEVTTGDVTKVGRVIDAALGLGMTDIGPIRFFATHTDSAYADAVREATIRARAQATAMANADGGQLGQTLELSTSDFDRPIPVVTMATSSNRSTTDIVTPVIVLQISVYGRWRLVEGRR